MKASMKAADEITFHWLMLFTIDITDSTLLHAKSKNRVNGERYTGCVFSPPKAKKYFWISSFTKFSRNFLKKRRN